TGSTVTDMTTPRISVEHAIAKALGVKPLILGACSHQTYGIDHNGMLFWDGTAPVDPEKSPVTAFDKLFAGAASSSGGGAASADVQLRNDLLAFTASEIQGLQSSLNGLTREQSKLQKHLDAVKAMQADSSGMGMMMGQSS